MRFGKRTDGPGAQTPRDPGEKRDASRVAVYRDAELVLSGGVSARCIAKDVSDTGCRVAIEGAANLPDRLAVRLSTNAPLMEASVVWRKALEAGLEFIAE